MDIFLEALDRDHTCLPKRHRIHGAGRGPLAELAENVAHLVPTAPLEDAQALAGAHDGDDARKMRHHISSRGPRGY